MINEEAPERSEPLIDSTYGYGSQALINLMLTGRATGYVWDNVQDIGGLSKFFLQHFQEMTMFYFLFL